MGPVHDELTALAVMFDRLLARSASALRYEQRLTAEIAHELRAPLTRAAVVTELALRHQRPSEELLRALDEVGTEIRSTVVVLDTLLAAASLTSGPRGSGDAGQAARDACEEASRLPRAHALRVRTHEADGVPTIGCDTRHAARTLAPLLDNAVQAANSDVTVEVTVDPETAEVVLAVLDDGDGITDADAQVILGAGVRGSASAERAGTGLGLALANRLAQAAGGRITIVAGRTGRVELRLPSLASAGRA